MQYGLMGAVIPLLLKKPVYAFLDGKAPGVRPAAVKKEYKAMIARQPEIGGKKNNLILGLYFLPLARGKRIRRQEPGRFSFPQSQRPSRTRTREWPRSVRAYSTRGGTSG